MQEISRIEDLELCMGRVVKVWWVPAWGWLFHIVGNCFEQLDSPFPDSLGVRSVSQVHDGVHGTFALTRKRFGSGMKVMTCDSDEEYANIKFSYGEQPLPIGRDALRPSIFDEDIFKHGEIICTTNTIAKDAMNDWVRKVANKSGQQVDWYLRRDHIHIVAMGDLEVVRSTIRELTPEHDGLYRKAVARIVGEKNAWNYRPPFLVA